MLVEFSKVKECVVSQFRPNEVREVTNQGCTILSYEMAYWIEKGDTLAIEEDSITYIVPYNARVWNIELLPDTNEMKKELESIQSIPYCTIGVQPKGYSLHEDREVKEFLVYETYENIKAKLKNKFA